MMPAMSLPRDIDWPRFDALHDQPEAWREDIAAIARAHGATQVEQVGEGTVLVARLGPTRMLKVYPPFLRDHYDFECAMLPMLHGRLHVPTPELLAQGEHEGWPYLVMTQLVGTPLTASWPGLSQAQRCTLLHALGALAAQVHAMPLGGLQALAPPWRDFITTQRSGCLARQQRHKLPAHLLAQLPAFIAGDLPEGPAVALTGEYTPFNLFTVDGKLSAMFDFGDGLVGPREYDWLGPLCFLAAGDAERVAAFMAGYGALLDDTMRLKLLRLLLLHRYSNPPAQIKMTGWQQAETFEAVAALIWP
jgi:hygromycin-B 7''-O-kinase